MAGLLWKQFGKDEMTHMQLSPTLEPTMQPPVHRQWSWSQALDRMETGDQTSRRKTGLYLTPGWPGYFGKTIWETVIDPAIKHTGWTIFMNDNRNIQTALNDVRAKWNEQELTIDRNIVLFNWTKIEREMERKKMEEWEWLKTKGQEKGKRGIGNRGSEISQEGQGERERWGERQENGLNSCIY